MGIKNGHNIPSPQGTVNTIIHNERAMNHLHSMSMGR